MAHVQDAGSHPTQDAPGTNPFGTQMPARLGAARRWLRRLAALGRAAVRLDSAAGLTERHLKDIGVPSPGAPRSGPLSVDVATRLSIRANGGF